MPEQGGTATRPKRCLDCGYILEGLPESRCPECGRTFDPADPRTYACRLAGGRRYLIGALVGVVILASAFGLAALCEHHVAYIRSVLELCAPPLLVGGLSLEFYVMVTSMTTLRRPRGAVAYRRSLWCAFVLSALLVVVGVATLFIPSIY